MRRRRFTGAPGTRLSALAAALFFGGCAVGPDFERPEVPWLADWSSGSLDSLMAEQRGLPKAQTEEWWRNFNDPALDHVVAEAQRVNPDVRTAGMRILEARAQLKIAGSLLDPQQQQLTGSVLCTGQVRSSGKNVALTIGNGGIGVGVDELSGRNFASLPTTPVSASAGKSISGANSGAASRLRMPAILPALRSMTIYRC